MNLKRMCLVVCVVLSGLAVPLTAQEKLGDFISQYGYEWMIGKWLATDQDGQANELEYKWGLDRHVVIVDVRIGDFKYHGMIMSIPSREEITQIGADNMGGTWKGTWDEDYEGVANRSECIRPDGTTVRMEHVYIRIDADSFKLKEYSVEAAGYRTSEAKRQMTFKRQKAGEAPKPGP
ncbi:MAG: hypothetical protein JSW66_09440 [Phycisphaerales bacterium]|nr:MAG: hypothetical protein JSW66_09440 [Phycisphaerales bacterium]